MDTWILGINSMRGVPSVDSVWKVTREFVQALDDLRRETGLSWDQFAARYHVNKKTHNTWKQNCEIHDQCAVDSDRLIKICQAIYRHTRRRPQDFGLDPVTSQELEGQGVCDDCRDEREEVPDTLRNMVELFAPYIQDKARGFVGRKFVREAFDQFCQKEESGYFVVRGLPGTGKTALLAKFVQERGYIPHFNIRLEGLTQTYRFLRNVCARLIGRYGLPHDVLPEGADGDSRFLKQLLGEASGRLRGKRLVLAVDALDEVDVTGQPPTANVLYLPPSLPRGVYFLVTTRPDYRLQLQTAGPSEHLALAPDRPENMEDVREYVRQFLPGEGIRRYLTAQRLEAGAFVERMVETSECNFMYLHFVLPAIEKGEREITTGPLPRGLLGYYQHHWEVMRHRNPARPEPVYRAVICALAQAKRAVTLDTLAVWSNLNSSIVEQVLRDWWQFLVADWNENAERVYRVYHESFRDFLAKEFPRDLEAGARAIATSYCDQWDLS